MQDPTAPFAVGAAATVMKERQSAAASAMLGAARRVANEWKCFTGDRAALASCSDGDLGRIRVVRACITLLLHHPVPCHAPKYCTAFD